MTGAHEEYPEGTIRHISETQAAAYGYSDGAQHGPERKGEEAARSSFLLAEAARSECARSMRAVWIHSAILPVRKVGASLEGVS